MQRNSVSSEVDSRDLSSFETRAWPDPIRRARSAWLSERTSRSSRMASASATFTSTNTSSASERLNSSPTVPNLNPAASSLFFLSAFIDVAPISLIKSHHDSLNRRRPSAEILPARPRPQDRRRGRGRPGLPSPPRRHIGRRDAAVDEEGGAGGEGGFVGGEEEGGLGDLP